MSHTNVIANVTQSMYGYFGDPAKIPTGTVVSWLPLYHDMGLILGICAPLVARRRAMLMSPMSFCAVRPAGCNCLPPAAGAFCGTEFRLRAGRAQNI